MFHRLHGRGQDQSKLVRGLSCDESGLYFGGDCPLVICETVDGGRIYRARPIEDLSRALSAGYGAEIDLGPFQAALDRVAEHLNKGEWGLAQITALQMRLPDLVDDAAVERLLKADQILRYNHNHDDQGRFATSADEANASGYATNRNRQPGTNNSPKRLKSPTPFGEKVATALNQIASTPNSSISIPTIFGQVLVARGAGSDLNASLKTPFGSLTSSGTLEGPSGDSSVSVSGLKIQTTFGRLVSAPTTVRVYNNPKGDLRINMNGFLVLKTKNPIPGFLDIDSINLESGQHTIK